MGKRRIVDMVTVSIEDKLESNGALRNVAVNDAWKRLRQNIDVKSWKKAEGVLQELSNSLQKINMLKSMTALFSKLRQAFQNPEQMGEESDYTTKDTPRDVPKPISREVPKPVPRETPREVLKPTPSDDNQKATATGSEGAETRDELLGLKSALQQIKSSIESTGAVPEQLDTPTGVSEDTKACYQSLLFVCDKCKKCTRQKILSECQTDWILMRRRVTRRLIWIHCLQRDLDLTKKRLENSETRNKDLEKQVDGSLEKLDKLNVTVDALEKKHSSMKEEKMESFKDQMKYKSLERQVELKTSELAKAKEENKDLKDRLKAIQSAKNSDSSDLLNPFPPAKLAEKYTELFNKERKDAFEYYKTTRKMTETDATKRLLDILQDCFTFCTETSIAHLQRLASNFVMPGENTSSEQSLSRLEEAEVKQIQSLRKQTSKVSSEYAKSSFIMLLESGNEEKYTFQEITDTMTYIEKCVEICWCLVLQTPPLHINFSDLPAPNKDIDKGKYDTSSGKGSKVEFVAWPPLCAWKDGDILKKGFVQAK